MKSGSAYETKGIEGLKKWMMVQMRRSYDLPGNLGGEAKGYTKNFYSKAIEKKKPQQLLMGEK